MPTMEMESRSTDKRIDDVNARMSEGFQRVHREIDGLDQRMTEVFQRIDREIKRVDGDIRELRGDIKSIDARFDSMHQTMMRGFFAIGGITVTLFLALAGLQGL
jgi:uncharacterized protein Yka (UPF0111/DUF47 family)